MQYLIITFDDGDIDWSSKNEILKQEACHVLDLYKDGTLRNIWFTEKKDAILIIEAENKTKALDVVNNLPLVEKGLLSYSMNELLPYTGIERIIHGTGQ